MLFRLLENKDTVRIFSLGVVDVAVAKSYLWPAILKVELTAPNSL